MNGGLANNVILVTTTNIDGHGIGALYIRDLMRSCPEVRVDIYNVKLFLMGWGGPHPPWVIRVLRAIIFRIGVLQAFRLHIFKKLRMNSVVKEISAKAQDANAEFVWVIASSPEAIWLANKLLLLGYEVRVTIWDAPEYIANNLRLPRRETENLKKDFEWLMKRVRRGMVVSNSMQEEYFNKYGVECDLIRHGIDFDKPIEKAKKHEEVRIVFAGSLYSKLEWNGFVEALSAAGWEVNGKKVVVYHIGPFPAQGAIRHSEVVFLGEKNFGETMEIMGNMDIGYLPYWFSEKYEKIARTSFPGKMSAYAAAGLCVFHHGPEYTEVTGFLEKYPFGVACGSLKKEDVMFYLERLLSLMHEDACREARLAAFNAELSSRSNALRFRNFLSKNTAEV